MTLTTSTEGADAPAQRVLERLARCRRLTGTTRFQAGGRTGRIEARVEVDVPSERVRVLRAVGTWRPREGGGRLEVRDRVRWTGLDDGRLRLEDRRGPGGARRLAVLHPRGPATWTAGTPHRCGDDVYRAVLRARPHGVELAWTVRGPGTQGRVVKRFHPAGGSGPPSHQGT